MNCLFRSKLFCAAVNVVVHVLIGTIIIFFLERTSYLNANIMLNLSDIAFKFYTITMLIVIDLQTIFHTLLIGKLVIYFHTKFLK